MHTFGHIVYMKLKVKDDIRWLYTFIIHSLVSEIITLFGEDNEEARVNYS